MLTGVTSWRVRPGEPFGFRQFLVLAQFCPARDMQVMFRENAFSGVEQ